MFVHRSLRIGMTMILKKKGTRVFVWCSLPVYECVRREHGWRSRSALVSHLCDPGSILVLSASCGLSLLLVLALLRGFLLGLPMESKPFWSPTVGGMVPGVPCVHHQNYGLECDSLRLYHVSLFVNNIILQYTLIS